MNDVTLANARVLVGEQLDETTGAIVEIRDGFVTAVRSNERPPHDAVDLDGAYVAPGLVDAHVHFDLNAQVGAYGYWRAPILDRSLTCVRNGLEALRRGITTIRDLGSADYMTVRYAQLVARGALVGPRMIAAGRFIAMTGGHMYEYGREADGPSDVRRAAREQIRAGARVIKVMATGGLSTTGSPKAAELTAEEMSAAADEAHKAGLRIAAHAHSPAGVAAAIAAGCDTIEHGAYIDAETIDLLLDTTIPLVPTVGALRHFSPDCGVDQETIDKSLSALPVFKENIAAAIKAGVVVAAGTDAGTSLNPIGALVDELRLYCELGMSTFDALRSATVVAGAAVGVGTGVIAPGAPADLVVTSEDPRSDLQTLESPTFVIRDGVVLAADELDGLARRFDSFASWSPARMEGPS